LKIFLLQH